MESVSLDCHEILDTVGIAAITVIGALSQDFHQTFVMQGLLVSATASLPF